MTSDRTIVGIPGGGRWVLASGPMGNYGDPPESPTHRYHIQEWRGSRSTEAETHLSLGAALSHDWVPEAVKDAVRELYPKPAPS